MAIILLPLTSAHLIYFSLKSRNISRELGKKFYRTRVTIESQSLIFFAPIDWGYRKQRPQQLAISLNRVGKDVFYVNPTVMYHSKRDIWVKIDKNDGVNVCTFYSNFSRKDFYIGVKEVPGKISVKFAEQIEQMIALHANVSVVVIIQQPGWWSVVRHLQNNQIIFDCMDLHAGFELIVDDVDSIESQVDVNADKISVTSEYLYSLKNNEFSKKTSLIRNGVDILHFDLLEQPSDLEKKTIGYFGALAEWFDSDIMAVLAQNNPEITFEIIGLVSDGRIAKHLSKYPNVLFLGEVKNSELPAVITKWRAGLIPFKLSPLILATNPVKMYEYAASGIPILATDIPEVRAVSKSVVGVYVSSDNNSFQRNLESALQLPPSNRRVLREWAQMQNWDQRAKELLKLIEHNPKVSVIVLMWNQGLLTLACLKSIFERSDYNNLEVILIDNDSLPEESAIVTNWIQRYNKSQTIYVKNEENLGFAGGNNVGLNLSTGDFVVLLNNDTEVTPGWIWRSLKHFSANSRLGLLGPSTNNCGNQARVKLRSKNDIWLEEVIPRFGFRDLKSQPSDMLAFFCVFIPRVVLDKIGLLSEEFGKGYFEDDDYCRRVKAAGYEISIARDIFVHHQMGASFDLLGDSVKAKLFKVNKAIYESKWGQWIPHTYKLDEDQM